MKFPKLRLPASPVESSLEARAFVFSGFAVAVLAIVLYGQSYVVPAAGLAVTALGHVISYRGRGLKRSFAGQAVFASLVIGSLAYFLADSVLALFGGVLPQANFAIVLVAVTSFDLKTHRNLYSSLWISLAILYLAAVYAWDYVFGLLVALWVICLVGFWMASHLRRMKARLSAPPKALATVVVGALVFGLAVFIFTPQPGNLSPTPLVVSLPNFVSFKGELENPALPLVQIAGDPSGATGSIDLHFRGRLGNTPVMYVRTGAPAYWRGLVFDTYRDGVWTASNRSYVTLQPYVPPRFLPPAPRHNLGTFAQVFRVLRPLPGVISAAYPIQSIYAPVAALRQDAYGTFHTPDALRPGQTYSVVSYLPNLSAQELQQDPFSEFSTGQDPAYLDDSALSQQARILAAEVVHGHTSSQFDSVMALTTYLQSNFQYSLQLGHVPAGRDPIDWFLFDVKIGYCEQFATAEVMMLRSLNIPARLATGYSTGDYDPVLDQSVVREHDAHAWVEVWFPNHGWVPVDPSPGFNPLAATRFPDHWAAGGIARLIPHLEIGAPLAALGSLGLLAVIPPAVAIALVVVIAYAWLRTRRWKRRVMAQPGESELLRLYERVQRRLGRRRAPPETPLEYRKMFPRRFSPPPLGGGGAKRRWGDVPLPPPPGGGGAQRRRGDVPLPPPPGGGGAQRRRFSPPPIGGGGAKRRRGEAELESLLEEVTDAVNEGAYAGRWPDSSRMRELSKRL